jgi:TatD DNase family protein
MMFADIHAHIQQHDPSEVSGIVTRARDAGVGAIFVSGTTVDDSRRCIELAEGYDALFAGIGCHPTELEGPLTGEDLRQLDLMAAHERVVALSEVGIDHQAHVLERPAPGRRAWTDVQEEAFVAQIGIARKHSLPLVFHVREPGDDPDAGSAWPHALRILRETGAGEPGGAAHYFQGNRETAFAALDAGFDISFARPLIRLRHLWEIAREIPADRIVLESDSYPQPFKRDRSKWTEPWHVLEVATRLAELRGESLEEVREMTSANALKMLGRRADVVRKALGAE